MPATVLADLAWSPADCIVLDLLIPGMEVDRVLARLREVWASVPVNFSTGTRTLRGPWPA